MIPVLKAVQLLWVNLIMDTFAALALATDPPTEKILDRPPQGKKAPLITINMWKMIIGQSIFQLVVTLVLYFAGPAILGYDKKIEEESLQLDTIIFNTFVWMQIFNEFNNRRLDNKFNIFEGVHRNKFFIGINILMVGLQILIIFIGSRAFQIVDGGLNGTQWAISVVTALACLPWAVLVRLFPDEWFAAIAKVVGKPFVIAYNAAGKAWNATFGRFFKAFFRLFKKSKKGDDEEAGEKDDSASENAAEPFSEKPGSAGSQNSPKTPNIPAIIAPEPEPEFQSDSHPAPPRIEVEDSEAKAEKGKLSV